MKRTTTTTTTAPAKRARRTGPKSYKIRTARRNMLGNPQQSIGFPNSMVMKHRYVSSFLGLTLTSGGSNSYKFSANGMYDPDISGGGHQPKYFDNMTSIYNHYHVLGSKITLKFVNQTGAMQVPVTVYLSDSTSPLGTWDSAAEEQTASNTIVPAAQTDSSPRTLTCKFSAKKYFNGDIVDNDQLKGTVAGNPAEQMYYIIIARPMDLSTTCLLAFTAEIEFYAVWSERYSTAEN